MVILTVTLNPALDLSTDVEKVESGQKLRCGPARLDPGGGGVNVTRAISKLGGQSLPFVVVGGVTGQMFRTLLENEAIEAAWFDIDAETRQSIMVYERATGEQYRFVLPGPEWGAATAQAMLDKLELVLRSATEPIQYVVASGSLPPGLPRRFQPQHRRACRTLRCRPRARHLGPRTRRRGARATATRPASG